MSNLFLKQATARDFSYCGEPGYCTKCLFRFLFDFITPIGEAHGEPLSAFKDVSPREVLNRRDWQEYLAQELLVLPLGEFVKLQYWEGHLRMAFYCISDLDLQASVLQRWSETPLDNVRFVDVATFHIIRSGHLHTTVGDNWIKNSIELAERTKDTSLVETLVWTLRQSMSSYPSFGKLARELGGQSSSVLKALNETSQTK